MTRLNLRAFWMGVASLSDFGGLLNNPRDRFEEFYPPHLSAAEQDARALRSDWEREL